MEVIDGVRMMTEETEPREQDVDLALNNIWRATCTVVGRGDLPTLHNGSGNIRKTTSVKLSCRIAPDMHPEVAKQRVLDHFKKR